VQQAAANRGKGRHKAKAGSHSIFAGWDDGRRFH
jgi:hypothetical protein